MSPHYLVKNNSSDAACRTVDNTTYQPALVREPSSYYWGRPMSSVNSVNSGNSVNWTLQTRHTVDRGDIDDDDVMLSFRVRQCGWPTSHGRSEVSGFKKLRLVLPDARQKQRSAASQAGSKTNVPLLRRPLHELQLHGGLRTKPVAELAYFQ